MDISEQYLKKIYIKKLKNLEDVTITFSDTRLTAIMGVNGAGKSTILHALACCYKSGSKENKGHNFMDFFIPNTCALWNDSDFTLYHSYKNKGKEVDTDVKYTKENRWIPRTERRLERHVEFIGIETCVPEIEKKHEKSFIKLDEKKQTTDRILKTVGDILNISYEDFYLYTSSRKNYIGVKSDKNGKYASLTMGAGEQRVFEIVKRLYNAPKYSLILIDEIDLLLHISALRRMIQAIYDIANDSKRMLQVVFTTHSMVMNELDDYVGIQYISWSEKENHTVVSKYLTPDYVADMTGDFERPIKIYVEDKLAKCIIGNICEELQCKRFVSISSIGPAINLFSLMTGMALNKMLDENTIAVLDGDVYRTRDDKLDRIKKVLTGQAEEDLREKVIDSIVQFNMPDNIKPEKWIRDMILSIPDGVVPKSNEIKTVLEQIKMVSDDHKYVDDAIKRLGDSYEIGIAKILNVAKFSDMWESYIAPVKTWISERLQDQAIYLE